MDPGVRSIELTGAHQNAVESFLGRDPVAGGLIHGLVRRFGFGGDVLLFGFGPCADPAPCGIELQAVASWEPRGRVSVCGDGPVWANPLAEIIRARLAGGRPLSTVDASPELGAALAGHVPPVSTRPMEIWSVPSPGKAASRPPPAEADVSPSLVIREAVPRDAAELGRIYAAERSLPWVRIEPVIEAARQGRFVVYVGVLARRPVCAAYASLAEPGASRVSGVVTVHECRRRGYAAAVVGTLARRLLSERRTPYLYVEPDDAAATGLYRALGFRPHSRRLFLEYGALR